jgi:cytochrome b561
MILCLIPMGLFVAVLSKSPTDREAFLSAHRSQGLTVLALVFLRLAWLRTGDFASDRRTANVL